MIERPLPVSIEAEKAILGSVILGRSIAEFDALSVEDFSLEANRTIFAAMNELWADGIVADYVTLGDLLRQRGKLEQAGGYAYLSTLTDGIVGNNPTYHIKIVKEKSRLRKIIAAANRAETLAYQQQKPEEILSLMQSAIVEVGADTVVRDEEIFLDVSKFIRQYHADIQWRVEGAIEVGTNGIMIGMSGDGKSPAARALAVALASGEDWLGLRVKRCRVALVSREDYAGTTSRFIKRYIAGCGIDEERLNLRDWLYISSRAQAPSLLLDNPSDLRLLINNLKRRRIDFCILDVLNVLHSKDENDNTEMRKVLAAIDHVRDEVGCQIMVLHHSRKGVDDSTSMAESGRGSSAIAGFAEFKIRIRTENEDEGIKQIRFKSKAGEGQRAFFWKISDVSDNAVILERVDDYKPRGQTQRRAAMSV